MNAGIVVPVVVAGRKKRPPTPDAEGALGSSRHRSETLYYTLSSRYLLSSIRLSLKLAHRKLDPLTLGRNSQEGKTVEERYPHHLSDVKCHRNAYPHAKCDHRTNVDARS